MEQTELRNSLTASLGSIYEIGAVENLTEFWQGESHVLEYLYQHSNSEINPSVLSDALNVSRARITAALSALRKKGYVTMEMCEHDRRRVRVILTDEGKQFIKVKQQKVKEHFDVLINGLGEENVIELTRLIDLSAEVMRNKSFG